MPKFPFTFSPIRATLYSPDELFAGLQYGSGDRTERVA
jgi:hypothetical protein